MENVCTIFSLIWFIGNVIFILILSRIADQDNRTILQILRDLTIELFCGKNWFGILLSIFVCIILVPSYIFALIIKVICMFCNLLLHVWRLGEKG